MTQAAARTPGTLTPAGCAPASAVTPDAAVLERNLRALSRVNPRLAQIIAQTPARPDAKFARADDGALTGTVGTEVERALASRRRPLDEARRFAQSVDPKAAAIFVVGGFGLGHHVLALGERLAMTGLVVVYEPDVALLRAVLERTDLSPVLGGSKAVGGASSGGGVGGVGGVGGAGGRMNVAILHDAQDTGAMAQVLQGLEGIVALGVQLVDHAPSKARLEEAAPGGLARFQERFVSLVKGVKLTIVTTLVQIRTTLRNLTQNLDTYLLRPGLDEWKGALAGRPAVVVSAGPSLARNVELLARPGVRDRVAIIAVQTVLKTLLRKGIRPHVVTALDYSDISARFYEGLSERDVEGVTLVVEPKVNPAVVRAFPGAIRCSGDDYLNQLLTPEFAPKRAALPPGATVAHLAYYLARFLGCDPVALIGQDLAFTDGQYYAAGAAIHQTWSGELSEFRTLESLEWERIARMGRQLHRVQDVLGRTVFTDEQMNSYRLQFERDFLADAHATGEGRQPLRVFDCTEGGVRKLHTECCTLEEFLARFAPATHAPGPADGPPVAEVLGGRAQRHHAPGDNSAGGARRLGKVVEHVRSVRAKAYHVGELSRKAERVLTEMADVLDDTDHANRLIDEVQRLRREVEGLEPAYGLVHLLNQSGALARIKADRLLQLDSGLSERQMQERQMQRDAANVRSLAQSADELGRLLDDTIATMPRDAGGAGAPKVTRDTAASVAADENDHARIGAEPGRVGAVVVFDSRFTPLGSRRPPGEKALEALCATLARLEACKGLNAGAVVTDAPEAVDAAVGSLPADPGARARGFSWTVLRVSREELDDHRRSVAPARLLARSCWRSAPASLTCYDEALLPRPALRALEAMGCDAALVVGPDWALIDPALCDSVIDRHRQRPDEYRLTFTQAPPGLCGAVLHRSLLQDLANLRDTSRGLGSAGGDADLAVRESPGFASVGGMLAYVPSAPATDLIAFPVCVTIDPLVRDTHERATLDELDDRGEPVGPAASLWNSRRDRRAPGTSAALPLDAAAVASALREAAVDAADGPLDAPEHLVVQIAAPAEEASRDSMFADPRRILEEVAAIARRRPRLALTLAGSNLPQVHLRAAHGASAPVGAVDLRADVFEHPRLAELIRSLRREELDLGAIHLRTGLLADGAAIEALLRDDGACPDAVSVDLMAESAKVYRAVTGIDAYGQCRANLERVLNLRRDRRGGSRAAPGRWLAGPLVVVRMTRCDAAYEEVESFYTRWMSRADWCVLDPLPPGSPLAGRIEALPLPESARRKFERSLRVVTMDQLL